MNIERLVTELAAPLPQPHASGDIVTTDDIDEVDEITAQVYATLIGLPADDVLRSEAFALRSRAFGHRAYRVAARLHLGGVPTLIAGLQKQFCEELKAARAHRLVHEILDTVEFDERVALVGALKNRYWPLLDRDARDVSAEEHADDPSQIVLSSIEAEHAFRQHFSFL